MDHGDVPDGIDPAAWGLPTARMHGPYPHFEPDVHFCVPPYKWHFRACTPTEVSGDFLSRRAWKDFCSYDWQNYPTPQGQERPPAEISHKSQCPVYTYCHTRNPDIEIYGRFATWSTVDCVRDRLAEMLDNVWEPSEDDESDSEGEGSSNTSWRSGISEEFGRPVEPPNKGKRPREDDDEGTSKRGRNGEGTSGRDGLGLTLGRMSIGGKSWP